MSIDTNIPRALWFDDDRDSLVVVDQKQLPFRYELVHLTSYKECILAIQDMTVRGAPVIGATAAFALYFAFVQHGYSSAFSIASKAIREARPTAVNLMFAIDTLLKNINSKTSKLDVLNLAKQYAEKDVQDCFLIGEHGLKIIEALYAKKQDTIHILTHCNAGYLATGAHGTATAPIYAAHKKGIPVHVWVDETRPRNQGANLTAWELQKNKVDFTIIADNTGGHLMQHQMVDLVIVGSDRTTANGDVANKIGTYLKALAAYDNQIPFYVALPTSTIDLSIKNGVNEIEIEQRDARELTHIKGIDKNQIIQEVQIFPNHAKVANYAFDVTPARFVTGLITEKGVVAAKKESIHALFKK
ncbi:MAG: S-methyl-5-thioribose-1-phosphate isomerase [Bacteroidales bacterium]|nr:S-methyl-5-thioribose-1-phosphate isomerase [Bacteroidales bacterium]